MAASRIAKLAFILVRRLKPNKQVTITTIYNELMLCSDGVNSFYVARPFLQRTSSTSHNGVSFSYASAVQRTATKSGEPDETQVLVPALLTGDSLLATPQPSESFTDPVLGSPFTVDVTWIDANVDGRAWAHDPDA